MRIVKNPPPQYREIETVNLARLSPASSAIVLFLAFAVFLLLVPAARFAPDSLFASRFEKWPLHALAFLGCTTACAAASIFLGALIRLITLMMLGSKTSCAKSLLAPLDFPVAAGYHSRKTLLTAKLIPDLLVCVTLATVSHFVPQDWFYVVYMTLLIYATTCFENVPALLENVIPRSPKTLFQLNGTSLTLWSEEEAVSV